MTDTPQPTPADDLVERVAQMVCDYEKRHIYTGRIWGGVLPRHTELARAVVALVLDEAVQALSDADNKPCAKCGHPRNNHPYRHPFVGGPSVDPVSVVRAMMPEQKDGGHG